MAPEFTSFAKPWRGGLMQDDLWRHACKLYAQPGVEAACLAAQAAGANVCLVLCAHWLERRGVAWTAARAEALARIAQPWAETVVAPLRTLRQQWKPGATQDETLKALRNMVKSLELDAERALLERLQAAACCWPAHPGRGAGWLDWALPQSQTSAALKAALAQG